MPSLPVVFRVCKEEEKTPRYVCEVPSHTVLIKLVRPHFPSQLVHTKQQKHTPQLQVLAMDEKHPGSQN